MSILTFPALAEFTHRGYPVTGYKVQDTGIAIQTHSMRQDTDCQTVPAMHGEDSGRSVYSQVRNTFQHSLQEMVGSGGGLSKVTVPDRHHN